MKLDNKPMFEPPRLFTLDGKEITKDNLHEDYFGNNSCSGGTGNSNTCSGGTGC